MTWLLIILGFCILGAPLIGFAALAWLNLAPLGYEDGAGFHYGSQPGSGFTCHVSGIRSRKHPPRQRVVHKYSKNHKRRAAASFAS